MRLRLALLASILTFAGSIAGFHATTTAGVPDDGAAAARAAAAAQEQTVAVVQKRDRVDCPEDRA